VLHFAFWTMQSLTRWPRAALFQAKNVSPCIDEAILEASRKPSAVPLVGYSITKETFGIATGKAPVQAPV
jgi:hypothetical protein